MGSMFDARRFLEEKFQTARGLIALLEGYGVGAPPLGTVEKWFQRARVPGEWFPLLLAYLELENGQPVRLAAYLAGGQKP